MRELNVKECSKIEEDNWLVRFVKIFVNNRFGKYHVMQRFFEKYAAPYLGLVDIIMKVLRDRAGIKRYLNDMFKLLRVLYNVKMEDIVKDLEHVCSKQGCSIEDLCANYFGIKYDKFKESCKSFFLKVALPAIIYALKKANIFDLKPDMEDGLFLFGNRYYLLKKIEQEASDKNLNKKDELFTVASPEKKKFGEVWGLSPESLEKIDYMMGVHEKISNGKNSESDRNKFEELLQEQKEQLKGHELSVYNYMDYIILWWGGYVMRKKRCGEPIKGLKIFVESVKQKEMIEALREYLIVCLGKYFIYKTPFKAVLSKDVK